MPLEGSLFLALWNDFDPARDAEYERWHTFEHVPERVAVPGMLRGRRYRAAEREDDRFFTLYEVRDEAVLTSPAYLDLVTHPTEWSRDMRPHFRSVVRVPCATLLSLGHGTGGHVSVAQVRLPRVPIETELERLRRVVLAADGDSPPTAFHVGRSIASLSAYPVFDAGQTAGRSHDAETLVLIAEAGARSAALAVIRRACEGLQSLVGGVEMLTASAYDLVFAVAHDEVAPQPNGRLAPRPDLRDGAARPSS